ncbi:hypothetical protein PILCRDRAFT_502013 [Piloderma croceum F 1598]|uniref:Uncharacterized protein n=1 Tax=Piloderma croceum (strain F 1598) TaxID=765440 RepID=A0A0C3B4L5_PILCF|nr:hypothetical protein PILCRDRAFT_744038 [Piloderma croceum F 1598]KIM81457.1 hypothetical protein PILCRDRAFT_502013 [Piloderma croceum F 1598]
MTDRTLVQTGATRPHPGSYMWDHTSTGICPGPMHCYFLHTSRLLYLFYWHPYYNTKGYNLVNYVLQTIRVISHVLLILFVPSLNVIECRRNHHHRFRVLWFRSKHHGFESHQDHQSRAPSGSGSVRTIDDGSSFRLATTSSVLTAAAFMV